MVRDRGQTLVDASEAGGAGVHTLEEAHQILGGTGPFAKAVASTVAFPNQPASRVL